MAYPKLVIEDGNPPILQTVVKDGYTGNAINDASVVVTILNAAGEPVSGVTWPLTVPYVASTAGVYRVQASAAIAVEVGEQYVARFKITVGGVERTLDYDVVVVQPRGDSTPPAASPASPAYEGPSLQQLLNEAELAYHRLLTGARVTVVVDQNGERVEYSPASRSALAAYIFSLRRQLGLDASARGPAGVLF